jgi:hypothetical protein
MARVSAVNGITIPELLEYACGAETHSTITNVDRDVPRSLIAGLAQACRMPEDRLAEIDLRVQLPNASPSSFLPVVHQEPKSFERSRISIPSCHLCLWEYESKGTSPYWKMEWALALVSRCPKHLVLLSEYCHHCFRGGLALVAHPKHGGLVARCTVCFRSVNSNSSSDPAITRYRTPLVASLGQALVSAYHGLDPDPMWLGPLNATTFLSVVDDLIWMFLDGNLRHGFPLIDDCAPAARCEMPISRARRRQLPLNLLFVGERELVVTAIAVALLGSRITKWFDIRAPLPVPVSELDSYPFTFVRWTLRRDGRSETAEKIQRWPAILRERALRHLPASV